MRGLRALLIAALPTMCQCSVIPADANSPVPDIIKLRPIAIRDYQAAIGLQRRDSVKFEDLDPQTQSKLIYGSPGRNGQKVLAEMTLYAPNGLQIVLMEKFEPLTSHVDCSVEGGMSLTFKDRGAYDYALKKWSFINEDKDDRFLLIANHVDCSPEDQRQPYYIKYVHDQPEKKTVLLTSEIAKWSDVAGTYELVFGHTKSPSQLKPRDWWDDVIDGLGDAYKATENEVEHIGEEIVDKAKGNFDVGRSLTFGVSAGKEGQKSGVFKDPTDGFGLECIDCYVKGLFKVTGHVKVDSWNLQDLTIEASPQDFHAMMKLKASVEVSESISKFSKQKNYTKQIPLGSFPVPDAGVEVPEVFKLGATLAYTIGFDLTFGGEAVVDFGLSASLSNGAKAALSLKSAEGSSASGFDGSISPFFEVQSLSASCQLKAYSEPKLELGIELNNVGKASVSLGLKVPEISSTLTAKADPKGVCPKDSKKTQTGVELKSEFKISLSAEATAALGTGEKTEGPKWSKPLGEKPIFDIPGGCWPLNIPGLLSGGGGDNSGVPPTSSKPTTPEPSSGAKPCTVGSTKGTCISTSACKSSGGKSTSGYCPNDPTDVQCCTEPNTCTVGSQSGTCISNSLCKGASTPGHCPNDPDGILCCTADTATPQPTGGGGGGCKKIKRDRMGKRMLVPC